MLQRLGGDDRTCQGGELRPLEVTTAARLAVLPDVPAVAEFLPSYEASIVAPRNTHIVNKLNQEINLALADTRIKQRIAALGDTPLALSAADFGKLIADETEKWGKVIRGGQHQSGVGRSAREPYSISPVSGSR
jgi:tripartite-type tricarboxylate transporter receptor subunit TctC